MGGAACAHVGRAAVGRGIVDAHERTPRQPSVARRESCLPTFRGVVFKLRDSARLPSSASCNEGVQGPCRNNLSKAKWFCLLTAPNALKTLI